MNKPDKSADSALTGWLPNPGLSVMLLAVWLLLNNTIAPGHIVLGGIIAFIIPLLARPLMTPRPRARSVILVVRYFLVLLVDIVRSNIEVAILICGPMHALRPTMLAIPLDLQDDLTITLLASTISLTPGTVSAEVSSDKKWLYVHALHIGNDEDLVGEIKERYERPLKEIYECLK